jgi:hypothetical protein
MLEIRQSQFLMSTLLHMFSMVVWSLLKIGKDDQRKILRNSLCISR